MWPKLLVECFRLTQYLLFLYLYLPLSIIYLQYFLIQNEAASHSELLMAKHAAQVQRRCLCLLPALSPCWGHTPLADPISSFSSIPSSIATRSHQQSSSPPRLLHFFCSLLPFLPALPSLASSPFSLVVAKKFSTQFTKFACCLCCFCFCLHFFLSPSPSPSPRLLSMIIFALFASQRLLTFRLCRRQGQRGVSSSLGARQLGSDCSQLESHWQCTV